MKTKLFDVEGNKGKEIELPGIFSEEIREDLVARILEAKKTMQPYAPSLVAGKQHSASGKIRHRRRKWRTAYGKGISRIPRKIMTRRGGQFNWVGAEVSSARGGRRAHPPKAFSMINTSKVNKKEMKLALISAVSATANKKQVAMKYGSLGEKDITELPFVVESKVVSLKMKNLIASLKKILGDKLFALGLKEKKVRAGKGKGRGRRYKSNAGLLIVTGNKEEINAGSFDVKNVHNLSIKDLAEGGLGRLTIYTENAIKEIGEKFGGNKK